MNFIEFLNESDNLMKTLFLCMDNANSAEKMYRWENIGEDNPAWKEGPYISAPANGIPISREQPYCLRLSRATSQTLGYQTGPTPQKSERGGFSLGNEKEIIRTSKIIPTVAVCMQFALLEAYDFDLFENFLQRTRNLSSRIVNYNRKPARERLKDIASVTGKDVSPNISNAYGSISQYRNLLTHNPSTFCPSAERAMDVYITCQAIAHTLSVLLDEELNPDKYGHRVGAWAFQFLRYSHQIDLNDPGENVLLVEFRNNMEDEDSEE